MTLQLPRVKKGGIFRLRGDRWTADLLEVSDLQRLPNIVKPTSERATVKVWRPTTRKATVE